MLRCPVLPLKCLIVASLLATGMLHSADEAEGIRFFEQKIRPLLVEHCYECHSAEAKKIKGGLALDTRRGWQLGGDAGEPALIPGDPEKSLILRAIRHDDEDLVMPPKKPKLPEVAIRDVAAWIKMGAPDPRTGNTEVKRADKTWWSLQPLSKTLPPTQQACPPEWQANPIDRFVWAKLNEKELSPNPPADRRALCRRLSYGLTGLPPSAAEIDAFVNDPDPLAYEKAVDRFLASPRYGEHWGRHWLDVIRFGESRGYERNEIILNAWPFRDYVIRSFNEDKPFNRFIQEHLAGDVLGKDQPDVEIGVAFLTSGPYDDVGNQDAVATANIRAVTVDDMVSAAGAAFLGLTVNCARCHHHKFDPIPTEDYYRMKAAFDGVSHGSRVLVTKEDREKHAATVAPLAKKRDALTQEKSALEKAIQERGKAAGRLAEKTERPLPSAHATEEKFAPVTARHIRFVMLATSDNPKSGVGARIDEFEVWTAGADSRNVALASNGAVAKGVASKVAADFKEAYSLENVNDGKFSARWFVGAPAELEIVLPSTANIERIVFSHDRSAKADKPIAGLGSMVVEYEILVSLNGSDWKKVADSFDRKPYNDALANERRLRAATTEERERIEQVGKALAAAQHELNKIPALPTTWLPALAQPKAKTVVFKGGDPMKPGDVVAPASLAVLDQVAPKFELPAEAPESERRLALARWMTSDGNPLTARVLANRVWQYHFGTGLVDTPSDFGFLGGKPSHPELLDWLSARLHAHGWKIKALHREILLSQTYRQSAAYREDGARADKDARLLWRFPPRRLSAEELRDTYLAVSGKLDLRMGGPGFRLYDYRQDNVATYVPLEKHGPETYRRAIYHHNARASVVDLLSDFDLPDNAFAAPKRSFTTTPLQALTLLNHSFTMDMARFIAEDVTRQAGADPNARIAECFLRVLQRKPTATEQAAALKLAQSSGLPALCRALLNSNALLYLD